MAAQSSRTIAILHKIAHTNKVCLTLCQDNDFHTRISTTFAAPTKQVDSKFLSIELPISESDEVIALCPSATLHCFSVIITNNVSKSTRWVKICGQSGGLLFEKVVEGCPKCVLANGHFIWFMFCVNKKKQCHIQTYNVQYGTIEATNQQQQQQQAPSASTFDFTLKRVVSVASSSSPGGGKQVLSARLAAITSRHTSGSASGAGDVLLWGDNTGTGNFILSKLLLNGAASGRKSSGVLLSSIVGKKSTGVDTSTSSSLAAAAAGEWDRGGKRKMELALDGILERRESAAAGEEEEEKGHKGKDRGGDRDKLGHKKIYLDLPSTDITVTELLLSYFCASVM